MNFNGPAKRIEDVDLPRVARLIGVGEDEIHAVMDVETAGGGFDAHGRPKMLFEPHVFYRNLSGAKRAAAIQAGLAYARWGERPYPKDSYPRLLKAMEIDETAALKSASWGLGQILGENYEAAGYDTVQDMVRDFTLDEDNHLEAMIRFIKERHLDDELRAHNWAGFARGYNGAQYAKHNYHGRLAAAYAKWRRIKDTPYDGKTQSEAKPAPKRLLTKDDVKKLQGHLNRLGYNAGAEDGKVSDLTTRAIASFQKANDLKVTGEFDEATIAAIPTGKPRVVERANPVPENSRIVEESGKLKKLAGTGFLAMIGSYFKDPLAALTGVSQWMVDFRSQLQPLADLGVIAMDHWYVPAAAVCVGVWVLANKIQKARIEDHRSGKTP